jgi:hypothetical protein
MANVLFKRGTHAHLPAPNAAQDGVFYLTTDTNRLYVGINNEKRLLNQTVQIISSISQLPEWTTETEKQAHKNDIFYISGGPSTNHGENGNILCIFDGTRWV